MFSYLVKNVKSFGLKETDVAADLGAGTGFYSVAAGEVVTLGKVYAIEINKDFLDTIQKKVKEKNLHNVEILWGNIEKRGGTKLGENTLDGVIASNILFQVEDKEGFIGEIKRILKPAGRLLLIDWSSSSPILKIKGIVPKEHAREMFERKGFALEREIDAGDHHYGMILVRKS